MALNYRIIRTNTDPIRYIRTLNTATWKYSLSGSNPKELICFRTTDYTPGSYGPGKLIHDVIFVPSNLGAAPASGSYTHKFSEAGMDCVNITDNPSSPVYIPHMNQEAALETLESIEEGVGSLEKVRNDGWTNAFATPAALLAAVKSNGTDLTSLSGTVLLYSGSDASAVQALFTTETIAFYDVDVNLNNLLTAQGINATPYRKIMINPASPYAAQNTYLWLNIQFLCDYIQSADFNQELTQGAFVEHKQIDIEAIRNFSEANGEELTVKRVLLQYDSQYGLAQGIIGDLINAVKVNGTAERQLYSGTNFTQRIYSSNGFLGLFQPLFPDEAEGIVTTEYSKNTALNLIDTDWLAWVAKYNNYIIGFKFLRRPSSDTSYSNYSTGNTVINGAAIIQFNQADREWQSGNGEELNIYQAYYLSLSSSKHYNTNMDTKLESLLPVIMRETPQTANDVKALGDNYGYITFSSIYNKSASSDSSIEGRSLPSNAQYKNDIKSAYDIHSKFFVELNSGKYVLHTLNSLEMVYDIYKTKLTQNSLDIGIDTSPATLPTITDSSYIAMRRKVLDAGSPTNTSLVGVKTLLERSTTPDRINYYTYVTDLDRYLDFNIDSSAKAKLFDYEISFANYLSVLTRTFTIGDIGKTADYTLKLYGDQIEIGRKGITADDNVTAKMYARGYFNRAIKIYSTDYSIPSAYPALFATENLTGSNISESGAFIENVDANYSIATIGYIKSPTITNIWKYIREIISGGYMTNGGTPCVAPENETTGSWVNPGWTIGSSNIWSEIDSEIAGVLGSGWKTTYISYLPTGANYQLAGVPLSLRALEKSAVIDRYNIMTYINYTAAQLVEKGSTDNVGGGLDVNRGTLYQVHKACTRWVYANEGGDPYSLSDNSYSSYTDGGASQAYLGADGAWHYLFLNTRLPVINE